MLLGSTAAAVAHSGDTPAQLLKPWAGTKESGGKGKGAGADKAEQGRKAAWVRGKGAGQGA